MMRVVTARKASCALNIKYNQTYILQGHLWDREKVVVQEL
jgi:hypothetical protein